MRAATAPTIYVLRQAEDRIAADVRLLRTTPRPGEVTIAIDDVEGGWWVDVAARDRPALLATVTGALADGGFDVLDAVVATWPDGVALEAFHLCCGDLPAVGELAARIVAGFGEPLHADALPEAEVTFDDSASPWHTVCEVRAPDKPGLLHSLATAFAAAGLEVLSASVTADDGVAIDRFEVADRKGAKLGDALAASVERYVIEGVEPRRWRGRPRTGPRPVRLPQ